MTPIYDRTTMQPFGSDPEYLTALGVAVQARARHLGARIEARREADEEGEGLPIVIVGDDPTDQNPKAARLASIDERLWSQIEARRKATKDAGRVLGLDVLCDEFDLDRVERQVIILAAVPCLGLDLYETLGQIGQFSFALMSVTPEMVAVFADLDLDGRLKLRDQLGCDGRLAQAGLIEAEGWGEKRVQDFWSSGVFLTEMAFNRVVGKEPADDGKCPCCGQVAGEDRP